MVTSNWDKFRLLLWKNWALQWNHKKQLAMELILPVVFSLLLVIIRTLVKTTDLEEVTYPPQNISNLDNLRNNYQVSFKWEVAYSPENGILDEIITSAASRLSLSSNGFPDSESLQTFLTRNPTFCGIAFDESLASVTEYPSQLKFALRFPSELQTNTEENLDFTWMTNKMFPYFDVGGSRNVYDDDGGLPAGYIREGFIAVQHAISMAFIEESAKAKNILDPLPAVVMQRYPYPEYTIDPLLLGLQSIISLIILLSLIYPCNSLIWCVTTEKEKQLKEVMKIMGLQNWLHWSAWFVKSFLKIAFVLMCMVVIIKIKWIGGLSVLTYVAWSTLIAFMLVYTIGLVTLCFMFSTFFSQASTAAATTGLFLFLVYLPFILTNNSYDDLSLSSKFGLCLLLNTAMGYGFKLILLFEGTGEGLQWSNMFTPVSVDDNFTLGYIILMMLLTAVIHMIICLYVEQIYPGDSGVPKVWYFPFKKTYWCGEDEYNGVEEMSYGSQTKNNEDDFEADPIDKRVGVQVKNLRKVFKRKVAVAGVSLNMFEDEITVLLGHNGAGKTTTISMIIGMFPPTSGTAIVNGSDIRTNTEGARMSMGICPQHDILFDDLTVRQHIVFYSRLKGAKGDAIDFEVNKYLKILGLEKKKNVASSKLSGGMKRKLSLCAALCGGTKVVLCDEPSSGMDPAARRQLWDLLQSEKIGRTILLTTHFMDEADVLGDRIAIMCDGELQCHGTTFFLKKRFGSGYRLICVKQEDCDSSEVTALLQKYIPNLQIDTEIGNELVYVLPDEYSKSFEEMFGEIEMSSEALHLNGFGISITSLEEVFMKVGAERRSKSENSDHPPSPPTPDLNSDLPLVPSDAVFTDNSTLLKGKSLLCNQWIAMLIKKYIYTIRNIIVMVIQIFIPLAIVIFAILNERQTATYHELRPLKIDFSRYSETHTVLETASNVTDESIEIRISDEYKAMFENSNQQHQFTATTKDFQQFILDLAKTILVRINNEYMASATVSKGYIIAWFNNQAYHTAPLSLNLVHNAMAKGILGKSYSIEVTNSPLPYTAETKIALLNSGDNLGYLLALNLCFCMCIVSALYVLFLIKERASRSKLLQFVSGVNVCTFWLTQLLWDMSTFIITALIIVITISCFQEDSYSTFSELGRLFLVLIIFGFAAMPLTYLISYLFSEPPTGLAVLSIFNIFTGMALFLLIVVMSVEELGMLDTGHALQWIFMIFPHFCLAQSIYKLFQNDQSRKICKQLTELHPQIECDPVPYFAWNEPGILPEIIYMVLCFVVVFLCLLMKEFRYFDELLFKLKSKMGSKKQDQPPEDGYFDEDVDKEKTRIKNMTFSDIQSQNLVLDRVTKYYNNFLAVNEVSVGIPHSECFGLLGVNGAGKTTTFKMMTGDEQLSSGDAYVRGYNLKSEMKEVYKEIGYCPQFDALLDNLTGRETLKIFCLLRGVPKHRISSVSHDLAKSFGFTKHLDKPTKAYSGGNKRKLSTAIAVMGSPSVIYLDEPTTGMDPAARRQLWNMIIRIRDSGKSIVLTSHSMEECEALCTRLVIMVNGEFKCIGSTQHLKNKFSKGLVLKMKLKKKSASNMELIQDSSLTMKDDFTVVTEFIQAEFPEAVLQEQYQQMLTFYIPLLSIKWSEIFGLVEKNLDELNIEDYSISQTTLEEIFLEFAKYQREDPREIQKAQNKCCGCLRRN